MAESFDHIGTVLDFLKTGEVDSRPLNLRDGQGIFQPHDPAIFLYVVELGEIRLFDISAIGKQRLLEIMGPNDLFGLASLGRLTNYGKQAVSVGDSNVHEITVESLRQILASRGIWALRFIEILALQLHSVWTASGNFAFGDSRMRLIRTLVGLANSPAAHRFPDGFVQLRMGQAQLAQTIGATRETVNMCLGDMRKRNLVEIYRGCVVYDPKRLHELCPEVQPTPSLPSAR